jgi:hypothetical protein
VETRHRGRLVARGPRQVADGEVAREADGHEHGALEGEVLEPAQGVHQGDAHGGAEGGEAEHPDGDGRDHPEEEGAPLDLQGTADQGGVDPQPGHHAAPPDGERAGRPQPLRGALQVGAGPEPPGQGLEAAAAQGAGPRVRDHGAAEGGEAGEGDEEPRVEGAGGDQHPGADEQDVAGRHRHRQARLLDEEQAAEHDDRRPAVDRVQQRHPTSLRRPGRGITSERAHPGDGLRGRPPARLRPRQVRLPAPGWWWSETCCQEAPLVRPGSGVLPSK